MSSGIFSGGLMSGGLMSYRCEPYRLLHLTVNDTNFVLKVVKIITLRLLI